MHSHAYIHSSNHKPTMHVQFTHACQLSHIFKLCIQQNKHTILKACLQVHLHELMRRDHQKQDHVLTNTLGFRRLSLTMPTNLSSQVSDPPCKGAFAFQIRGFLGCKT